MSGVPGMTKVGIDCPVNAALTAVIKAMDRCTMTP